MHTHYLGLVVPTEGGTPSFVGPFLTHAAAHAAVQEQLGQDADVMGGVVPFDFVEAAPKPARAPAPSAAPPSAEEQNDGSGSSA